LPWYVAQHRVRAENALIAPPTAFFSLQQISPRLLLHDFAGDGYACAVSLLLLAMWGIARMPKQRQLLFTAAVSIGGPILMDAVVNYFYAERQLLYAMPALVLLAGQGAERMRVQKRGLLACTIVAVFVVAAGITNFRQATVPRDDLAITADAIAAHLRPGACLLAAPKQQIGLYTFFHPELEARTCNDDRAAEVLTVASIYTTADERRALTASMATRFEAREHVGAGRSELTIYQRR
jgi:hypothetical protein